MFCILLIYLHSGSYISRESYLLITLSDNWLRNQWQYSMICLYFLCWTHKILNLQVLLQHKVVKTQCWHNILWSIQLLPEKGFTEDLLNCYCFKLELNSVILKLKDVLIICECMQYIPWYQFFSFLKWSLVFICPDKWFTLLAFVYIVISTSSASLTS